MWDDRETMERVRTTVGAAIVRYLAAQYSDRDGVRRRLVPAMWAILGHGNVAGLGQALEELGDEVDLPTYRPQHEQAMVHLAAAFAKHTDRAATFACTASVGPGSLNMLTAAAGATVNRLPVLLFPSDTFANRLVDPVLQQLEHPIHGDVSVNDCFRPISRSFTRITRPEQLLAALPEAMRVLTDPVETGAVTIALPEDVQAEAYDFPASFFAPRVWRIRRPEPDPVEVEEAARAIVAATRPIVVAGGGVLYAGAAATLAAFAAAYGLPVVETQAGKGALDWRHPSLAGPVGSNGGLAANRLARDADLVIAVGTRLGDFVTASRTAFQHPDVRFVGLNVVPFDASKLAALPLVADARSGLEALSRALAASDYAGTSGPYRAEVATLRRGWDVEVDAQRAPRVGAGGALAQGAVIGAVNDAVGGRATVVCAAGSLPGDLLKLWRPEDPKAYHLEYGFSCMGYELPAALGIKLAERERDVVVMVGDGSYLMMNSELVTAVAEGIDLTVVLVDNGGFGSINGLQTSLGTPSFVNELRHRDAGSGRTSGPHVPVDFVAHAAAMGARATLAGDLETLRAALAARREGGVHVIVVPTDPALRVPGYESWWDVPVAEVSQREGVREARRAYEAQAARRRVAVHHTGDGIVTKGPEGRKEEA
jgi:3D-(3,5/4)-trihydroxycyclohexane-1,2-dione acylhydrolase (decyclizing)